MGVFWEGDELSSTYMKTGHTLDSCPKLGKDFSFKRYVWGLFRVDILKDNHSDFVWDSGILMVKTFDKPWDFPGFNKNTAKIELRETGGSWAVDVF